MRYLGMAVLALGLATGAAEAQEIKAGVVAPEIELPTLQGGKIKLSTLRGHPVVVTFWGTWCPPCKEEFPELVALHEKHRDVGLDVLAVNQFDQELGIGDVHAFVKAHSVRFTVAIDKLGKTRQKYRLISLPTTVFIDSAGIIREVHSGPINRAKLASGLAMILPPR